MSTKAQVWTTDFIISILILVAMLTLFGRAISNLATESREDITPLIAEGRMISDQLMSEGYPSNWNTTNVISFGITTDKRIDKTKAEMFYSMNYSEKKRILNTDYNFYTFLIDENNQLININGSYGTGQQNVTSNQTSVLLTDIDFNKLAKITRLTIYESKITRMVIYVWQ